MKKQEKGFTLVELLVVIGILGILMGALFPAVAGAMLSAKTAACAADGRNLIMGIITANTDRENGGQGPLWPRTDKDDSAADDDKVGQGGFSRTVDYFNALFNMDTYGNENWEPEVDKSLFPKVFGQGVPGPTSTTFEDKNCKWVIAANLDNVPGNMPILLTRNVAIGDLKTQDYDGKSTTPRIKLGKKNGGGADDPFGADAVVIVRKDGGAQTIKARQCNPKVMYQQGFKLTSSGGKAEFQYLPCEQ